MCFVLILVSLLYPVSRRCLLLNLHYTLLHVLMKLSLPRKKTTTTKRTRKFTTATQFLNKVQSFSIHHTKLFPKIADKSRFEYKGWKCNFYYQHVWITSLWGCLFFLRSQRVNLNRTWPETWTQTPIIKGHV